jgi:hypothetical protein
MSVLGAPTAIVVDLLARPQPSTGAASQDWIWGISLATNSWPAYGSMCTPSSVAVMLVPHVEDPHRTWPSAGYPAPPVPWPMWHSPRRCCRQMAIGRRCYRQVGSPIVGWC